ncbi:hypothetical protein CGRA01v4_02088 [Colletotrichum graminicola]|nr:hypothetical protein CGRA01v4_02088 [Colletotrichum graminicola]
MSDQGCKRGGHTDSPWKRKWTRETQATADGLGRSVSTSSNIWGEEAMTRVQHGQRMDGHLYIDYAKRNDMKVETGLVVSLAWPYRTSQVRSMEGKEPHPTLLQRKKERTCGLHGCSQEEEPAAALPRDDGTYSFPLISNATL